MDGDVVTGLAPGIGRAVGAGFFAPMLAATLDSGEVRRAVVSVAWRPVAMVAAGVALGVALGVFIGKRV